MDSTLQLIKELTEAHGIPGYETEIRALVRGHLEKLGHIDQDRIGSLVCSQGNSGPRVMLAGHMDEIGFMVNHITLPKMALRIAKATNTLLLAIIIDYILNNINKTDKKNERK